MAFGVKIKVPQLLFLDDTFLLAYGPLLFIFTQSVIFKNYTFKRKDLLHFIPFFVLILVFILMLFFMDTASFDQTTLLMKNQNIPIIFRIGELSILLHILYYLYKSKTEIKKVLGKAMDYYSSFNQDNFKLLQFILNCFIGLFSLALVHSFLPFVGIKSVLLITMLLIVLFMLYFINSVLLKMLNQSSNETGAMTQAKFSEKVKYAGSKLEAQDLTLYKNKLAKYMMDTEKYLDSELNIVDLSKELNISSKLLSQVINEGYNCNFFDFVNNYRIDMATSLFRNQTDTKLTISEVMYDSGFNSKSSFNTAFKKFTQKTPTQFKNDLKKGSTS
ncbi:helix-turn-helix domain-containing protein [Lutimonas halocynthiae]|uniref:helix-turn-helix domain-containing protein n=1 Tax=Lutimonas halocynthiae TaxID=1446477 RepID=UPI0025B43E4C|nr:helix-turn-helix domain-containing protein [Lutimonas halocynthiae]